MRKKFHILFIALAAAVLLMSGLVPHHHHEGAVCVTTGHCEKDDHADGDADHHGRPCIVGIDFVITQADNGTRCKVASCDDPGHVHLFPILSIIADVLPDPAETPGPKPDYGEYILFYTSAEASRFHGLRAPPFMLS